MFKTLQVVRLTQSVRNTLGHPLKAGSRVVVVNVTDGVVKARYGTSKADYRYIKAPVNAFVASVRGRPVGTGKKISNVTKVDAAPVAVEAPVTTDAQ
jgi:hypothetical protein